MDTKGPSVRTRKRTATPLQLRPGGLSANGVHALMTTDIDLEEISIYSVI